MTCRTVDAATSTDLQPGTNIYAKGCRLKTLKAFCCTVYVCKTYLRSSESKNKVEASVETRRSTIEVDPKFSEAPHLV